MITFVKGNLFQSPAKVLVNTVNTVGVMGKGIALVFKNVYPEMFARYQKLCEERQIRVGSLWLYKTPHKWILNFPTKEHWRSPSTPEYIEAGLRRFVATYAEQGITSVAFPELGCGNGELDWITTVRPLMVRYLARLPVDIFIYEYVQPATKPEHKDVESVRSWLRSEPRSLAFDEVWSDLKSVVARGISLETWDEHVPYGLFTTDSPETGIRIELRTRTAWAKVSSLLSKVIPSRWRPRILGPEDIFIPQEALLELWQGIRGYGFCVPRIMPAGLDVLAPYLLPLLAKLPYLPRVELTTSSGNKPETALRLYALPKDRPVQQMFDALIQPG
ncbi:MAG TPA: macro domain-containing protein [Polyangia bacterium]|nr:macro domain-containing protein [Polyangia bacterium]